MSSFSLTSQHTEPLALVAGQQPESPQFSFDPSVYSTFGTHLGGTQMLVVNFNCAPSEHMAPMVETTVCADTDRRKALDHSKSFQPSSVTYLKRQCLCTLLRPENLCSPSCDVWQISVPVLMRICHWPSINPKFTVPIRHHQLGKNTAVFSTRVHECFLVNRI
jgi:hypothetical protein